MLFLVNKVEKWENLNSFIIICDIFMNYLKVQNEYSIFFSFNNPFKIFCLIYEILNKALKHESTNKNNILEC